MKPRTIEFTVTLPAMADDLGRWMEANGVRIELFAACGLYQATVTKRKIESYSDDAGEIVREHSITRSAVDAQDAIKQALDAAGASKGKRTYAVPTIAPMTTARGAALSAIAALSSRAGSDKDRAARALSYVEQAISIDDDTEIATALRHANARLGVVGLMTGDREIADAVAHALLALSRGVAC